MVDSRLVPDPRIPLAPALKLAVVRPTRGWRALNLGEIYRYRDLLGFLVWRDTKIRYQQTFLGGLWAILQPLAMTAAFTFVFGHLARIPSDSLPYPLFSFAGLMAWNFFSGGLNAAADSLVVSSQLVGKVYFPRLILPLSAAIRGAVDLCIALVAMLVLMAVFGVAPSWRLVFVAPLTLVALAAAIGVGAGLGAINVRFRDVRNMMPLITQLWLFLSPVAYPASLAPKAWRPWLGLNPMSGVVEGYRWALLGRGPPPLDLIALSTLSAFLVLVAGLALFRRMEASFADVI
jgi:lipopolysaccharide transport system permease protein